MICINDRQFLISGKTYSYAMRITQSGFLQHLHYGGKISEADLPYLSAAGETTAPKSDDFDKDSKFDGMLSEYGFYAHGDYKEPTAIFEREDGARMSRLRYLRYRIEKGAPQWKSMPHARKGDETLVITLKDDFSDAEADLYYTASDDSDVLVRNAVIRNAGESTIEVTKAFSFRVELPNGTYRLLRLGGDWTQERMPEIAPIAHGITKLQSLRGMSSHQTNPFMGILTENCGEENGDCFGIQLVYSGSFALTAECSKTGALTLQGGICDTGFCWELGANEELITPQVLLTYSNKGLGGMSRSIHDFIRDKIMRPEFAYKVRPVVANNWEATYFDFDNEKLFPIIDEAAKLGVDIFVLDDGWFGKRNSDWAGLGDWQVNEQKLKGGLKTVIDRCKGNGLKFGLWFEPEMVNEDSDLYRAHPDWAIGKDSIEPCRSRHQLVLDFTRKEVVDYIFASVSEILRDNDIAYVKWDMNRGLTECYSRALPARKQGEFMHRYVMGVYNLAERLTSAFPTVFFEGCAGGGGRFDAGMLYYFPQIWTSDNTDGFDRAKIQWGTSLCYPLSSMSCHVSVCPNHQTGRMTPLNTRGNIASLGAFGYELDLSKLSQDGKETVKSQIKRHEQTRELILKGDLYRLLNPFESDYFCEMIVSKDKSKAYVVGECMRGSSCEKSRFVKLKGLEDNAVYEICTLDITVSGKFLMSVGLTLPKLRDYESWAWCIEKQN